MRLPPALVAFLALSVTPLATPVTAAPRAAARPTLRLMLRRIHTGMTLAALTTACGPPNTANIAFHSGDRGFWTYDAADGRLELTVAPRVGRVTFVSARPSLALARSCVRVGRTLAQAQAAFALALPTPTGRAPVFVIPDPPPAHASVTWLRAADGDMEIRVDPRTHDIRRVSERPHP